MSDKDYTLISPDDIAAVIDETGSEVLIFLPDQTVDMQGDTRINYLGQPVTETATIRPRTDTTIINEQGQQREGDALGYFKNDSAVTPESEVWHRQGDVYQVYYVISIQPSYFEDALKFVKGVLQQRRIEPVDAADV